MVTHPRLMALALALSATTGCTPPAADAREDAATAATPALTDPQIAHVAVTANTIDIEIARLVDSRTTTPEVRGFARTMITDHTAVNERAAALAQRLGVTPEDNPVSRSLRESADEARERLTGLRGEEFDRAYLAREVEYHRVVLDALDDMLIPGATNTDLRSLLQEVRPVIAAHLEHARMLRPRSVVRRHEVAIRGFEYLPASLTAVAGDTVVWMNHDAVPHTATAVDGAWDSGSIAAGDSWSRVVTAADETTSYTCTFHPNMTGELVIR